MKITDIKVDIVNLPVDNAYIAGGQAVSENCHVVVRLRTSDGVEGVGYVVKQRPQLIKALAQTVRDLADELIGMNVMDVEAAWAHLAAKGKWVGPGGMLYWAIAPLDIALWDAAGKTIGQPLYRMLGGYRDHLPAYASDGLWYSLSLDELAANAKKHAADGHTAMKLRLGRDATAEEQAARVRTARDASGLDIMVDATESWDLPYARLAGPAVRDAGAVWLEDPVHHDDLYGLALLSQSLDIPVTGGENLYTLAEFRRTMDAHALDILIIDLFRVGGITPWRKVAANAESHRLQVCGHVVPEVHVHLLAAVPNGHKVEFMPRSTPLLENMPIPEAGVLRPAQGPGHGLVLDSAAFDRYHQAAL